MASLALEGVSRTYPGGVAALDRVSLHVSDEEFVVIVGPSGCGKSTTLRLIAGLEAADEGNIRIGERRVNDLAPKNRNVAMVFQNYALYPHMNVSRNMAFALELRSGGVLGKLRKRPADNQPALSKAEIKQRVTEVARKLGIERLLDRKPGQLSGGEKQRVALGRAIVRRPDLFLFDEPLSNLDARLRVDMRQELKRLHRELRTTMIYVTHDQVEAMTLGDRVVVMQGGRVQQVGKPLEVYDQPANRFVAGFIGSPTMNFLEGTLTSQDNTAHFQAPGLVQSLAAAPAAHRAAELIGQSVTLGIRPEAVHLAPAVEPLPVAKAGQAEVLDLEPQGDATIVHLQLAGPQDNTATGGSPSASKNQTLTAKLSARTTLATGDAVHIGFEPAGCHLFDAEGENLSRSAASTSEPLN